MNFFKMAFVLLFASSAYAQTVITPVGSVSATAVTMSKQLQVGTITNAAGTGAPNFSLGLTLSSGKTLQADTFANSAGTGAPNFSQGLTVTSGKNIDVTAAGALTVGGSVGANTVTIGGSTSTVSIPGTAQFTTITTPQATKTYAASMTLDATNSFYYTLLTGNVTTLNLSGWGNGYQGTWVVCNTSGSTDYTIAFSGLRWRFATAVNTVYRSTCNVYSFVVANSIIFAAASDQM